MQSEYPRLWYWSGCSLTFVAFRDVSRRNNSDGRRFVETPGWNYIINIFPTVAMVTHMHRLILSVWLFLTIMMWKHIPCVAPGTTSLIWNDMMEWWNEAKEYCVHGAMYNTWIFNHIPTGESTCLRNVCRKISRFMIQKVRCMAHVLTIFYGHVLTLKVIHVEIHRHA